uniref:Uncharacterized protein n=1 Tax=Octopus bimaculoides TaxID=37653 RepID=A0A0L8GP30_OCTBM
MIITLVIVTTTTTTTTTPMTTTATTTTTTSTVTPTITTDALFCKKLRNIDITKHVPSSCNVVSKDLFINIGN